ncbi:TIGR02391 family protein [Streptomyces sp. NPDC048211]|uniref:TIGR02391 family protein n=1 Tax=Streptomyces sp. NPDC048211 TaxID=3365516 RepID=UPI0037175E79
MRIQTIAPKGMPRPTGEEGHVLLDAIWAYFREHHCWPTFDDIDRKLYAQDLQFEDVVQQLCPALLRGVGPDISQLPQGSQDLGLTIAGAANCTGTGVPIRIFLDMVRTAADLELAWLPADRGQLPWMQPSDLGHISARTRAAGILAEARFAAAAFAQQEACFRGGSIKRETLDWSLSFDRGIRPFAGVQELEEYWRIREQVLGPKRIEDDNRLFAKRPTWFSLPEPPRPAADVPVEGSLESMSVTCVLHPEIALAAAERFNSGFYLDAVSRAFQAVEHRVQTLAGSKEIGERLMGIAFGAKPGPPLLTVTRSTGASLDSEQNGMQFLFKGATGALRNPRMHGPAEEDARDEAEEMLVFASFLMRRLDIEDDKRDAAATP